MLQRRRTRGPGNLAVHRSVLDQRQHRPLRPAEDPGGVLDGIPRPGHDVLGGGSGSLGIGTDLPKWSEEELEEAGKLVRRYKHVRDIVQEGDQYRLLSPWEGETTAVQYISEDQKTSVIFV